MTAQRITYVRCNTCGACALPDGADEGMTATEQRREAKRELGWTRGPNGEDYCEADSVRET